ncbi:YolD-like protein [compost metagenome]
MNKKLVANGLWESSRMMLPQHKEMIIEHHKQQLVREKPTLHQDEWENIFGHIEASLYLKEGIQIEMYNEIENIFLEGTVTSISQNQKKLKIENENGFEWVDFDEIVSVSIL